MKRLNIALMAGGDSSEREIALQSAAQIASALDPAKYDITLIDLHGRDWHYTSPDGRQWQVDKNDFSITIDGDRKTFDYSLILIHGTPGENGRLQGYLDMMGIPYSSCSMTSSVVTFDKITTKRTEAFSESDEILIEECIRGREMGCGMLIAKGREYIFPITEIVSKKEFFDYEAKYTAGCSDEITPADIAPEIKAELNRLTALAYKACRCRGVVRVDFIVTPEGKPYLIEINSIPGMSGGSIVPKQVREAGMTLGELYDLIIEDTYDRDRR